MTSVTPPFVAAAAGWKPVTSRTSIVHGLSVKDFRWVKGTVNASRRRLDGRKWCLAEKGMVDFAGMLAYFKSAALPGPVELYQEYSRHVPGLAAPVDMLGTDFGKWKLEMRKAQYIALLKRDVDFYTNALTDAGLVCSRSRTEPPMSDLFTSLPDAIAQDWRRRCRRAGGFHASDSFRGGARGDPPGSAEPHAGAHDAGPDLRSADWRRLCVAAGVLVGRQSRRRVAASLSRCG